MLNLSWHSSNYVLVYIEIFVQGIKTVNISKSHYQLAVAIADFC